MSVLRAGRSRLSVWLQLCACVLMLAWTAPAAAIVPYIPNTPGELNPAERVTIASPRPVQLLFTFQTSGAPNMRATNEIRDQVNNEVRASGLFSEIGQGPAAGGAVLSVTFNNIPEADAARRGVAVGLTFGLHGETVRDSYVVTFEYLSGPDATPIRRTVEHAIIATAGRTSPPENATRVRNLREAATIMVRQSIAHGLNALAGDPGFVPAAPASPQ